MSVHIEVLGPGCARCQALYENTKAAVDELGIDARVEKIDDVTVMVMRGVMESPALMMNGKLVLAGNVPTAQRLGQLIAAAM